MASRIANRLLVIDGHKKNGDPVWKKIGVIMENNGKKFMLLDKSFNPAGVETDGNSSVMVTIASAVYDGPEYTRSERAVATVDDDIPF